MSKDLPGLLEFMERFPDEQTCGEHLREARWGTGFECPMCEENEHWGFIRTRKRWECYECGHQCSVTSQTIMHDTKLPLRTWFLAAYLVFTTKKGISSHELARKLDIKQESAWYLQQRLSRVVGTKHGRQLFGLVEADESYVGGKGSKPGRSTDKTLVLGLVEDKGESAGNLHLRALSRANRDSVQPVVEDHVELGACVRTDGWSAYAKLEEEGYEHDPHIQERPEDASENLPWVHVVFSNLKRVIMGTHTRADEPKFQGYLDLFNDRFNWRARLGKGLDLGLEGLANTPALTRKQIREQDMTLISR